MDPFSLQVLSRYFAGGKSSQKHAKYAPARSSPNASVSHLKGMMRIPQKVDRKFNSNKYLLDAHRPIM
jgi:hypothetical protein